MTMRHITIETAERYLKDELSLFRKASVERHAGECETCSQMLNEMKQGEKLISELQESLDNIKRWDWEEREQLEQKLSQKFSK